MEVKLIYFLWWRPDNMMNREEFYISDWDMMMKIWPNCPVDGCKNKINLNLNTGKCFPHSEGSYQWKSFKILFKNTFIHSPKLLWRKMKGK
jgi:hypothetical protein